MMKHYIDSIEHLFFISGKKNHQVCIIVRQKLQSNGFKGFEISPIYGNIAYILSRAR
jgi:hypothetical protein